MILQEDESRRLFQMGFAAIGEYDIKAISWSEFAAFYCQVPQVDGSRRKWTEVDGSGHSEAERVREQESVTENVGTRVGTHKSITENVERHSMASHDHPAGQAQGGGGGGGIYLLSTQESPRMSSPHSQTWQGSQACSPVCVCVVCVC